MITFESDVFDKMLGDALQTYPDECCGFLFGAESGELRAISDIMIVDNAKEGDKRRRFEITARDYLRAERYAEEKKQALLGVYHSHPNHPAIPSEHDRVAAQPFFSYVIVSVYDRGRTNTLSWRLDDDFKFVEEPLELPVSV